MAIYTEIRTLPGQVDGIPPVPQKGQEEPMGADEGRLDSREQVAVILCPSPNNRVELIRLLPLPHFS